MNPTPKGKIGRLPVTLRCGEQRGARLKMQLQRLAEARYDFPDVKTQKTAGWLEQEVLKPLSSTCSTGVTR